MRLPSHLDQLRPVESPGTRGLGHLDPGLFGLHQEADAFVPDRLGLQVLEMPAVQVAIALHPPILDLAIQRRPHRQRPGPVLRRDDAFDRGHVHIAHVHQAATPNRGRTAVTIAEADVPFEDAVLEIELLPVIEEIDRLRREPIPRGRLKREEGPVGPVDQVLILDDSASDLGPQAVVTAGQISPGIMDPTRLHRAESAAGSEVPVAQRAQRFAQRLFLRLPPFVDQFPPIHHRPSFRVRTIRSRNCRTSSVSRKL